LKKSCNPFTGGDRGWSNCVLSREVYCGLCRRLLAMPTSVTYHGTKILTSKGRIIHW